MGCLICEGNDKEYCEHCSDIPKPKYYVITEFEYEPWSITDYDTLSDMLSTETFKESDNYHETVIHGTKINLDKLRKE